MSENEKHRTPYADDALVVKNGTQPDEIRDFVRQRTLNPEQVAEMTVWNYNNHEVNTEVLRETADELARDEYVIPYQVSGVWAYMTTLLPKRVREAEILTYSQDEGDYRPYPNYFFHSEELANGALRAQLTTSLSEGDDAL